jgi:hypothetical protein
MRKAIETDRGDEDEPRLSPIYALNATYDDQPIFSKPP